MIINANCVGCGQCVAFCEKDAIVVRGRARMNDACINCAGCAPYCPMKAIEVEQ